MSLKNVSIIGHTRNTDASRSLLAAMHLTSYVIDHKGSRALYTRANDIVVEITLLRAPFHTPLTHFALVNYNFLFQTQHQIKHVSCLLL